MQEILRQLKSSLRLLKTMSDLFQGGCRGDLGCLLEGYRKALPTKENKQLGLISAA